MAPLWDWELGPEAKRHNWRRRAKTAARLCEMFGVDGYDIKAQIVWFNDEHAGRKAGCWFCWSSKDGKPHCIHVPNPRWGLETHEMAELAVKVKLTTCL